MNDFDEVMMEVAKLVPSELFLRLNDVICKEIEEACEAELYDRMIKQLRDSEK